MRFADILYIRCVCVTFQYFLNDELWAELYLMFKTTDLLKFWLRTPSYYALGCKTTSGERPTCNHANIKACCFAPETPDFSYLPVWWTLAIFISTEVIKSDVSQQWHSKAQTTSASSITHSSSSGPCQHSARIHKTIPHIISCKKKKRIKKTPTKHQNVLVTVGEACFESLHVSCVWKILVFGAGNKAPVLG